MNWIEELYQITEKDPYSQYGEGKYLEHIFKNLPSGSEAFIDIGAGDGVHLSNTRYLKDNGWWGALLDKVNGQFITAENILDHALPAHPDLVSIDIDGNDYWVLKSLLSSIKPKVIIAEFNAAFTDDRVMPYNPEHVWAGDNYYGFSFLAGQRLGKEFGYEVIFQNDNVNMYFVQERLINVPIPPVTFQKINFFTPSDKWNTHPS